MPLPLVPALRPIHFPPSMALALSGWVRGARRKEANQLKDEKMAAGHGGLFSVAPTKKALVQQEIVAADTQRCALAAVAADGAAVP